LCGRVGIVATPHLAAVGSFCSRNREDYSNISGLQVTSSSKIRVTSSSKIRATPRLAAVGSFCSEETALPRECGQRAGRASISVVYRWNTRNTYLALAAAGSSFCSRNREDYSNISGPRVTSSSKIRVTSSSKIRVTSSSKIRVTSSSKIRVMSSSQIRVTSSLRFESRPPLRFESRPPLRFESRPP
jgi:hypothetical protein